MFDFLRHTHLYSARFQDDRNHKQQSSPVHFTHHSKSYSSSYLTLQQESPVVAHQRQLHKTWHFIPPAAPHFDGLLKPARHFLEVVLLKKSTTFTQAMSRKSQEFVWGSGNSNKDRKLLLSCMNRVQGVRMWGPADPTSIPASGKCDDVTILFLEPRSVRTIFEVNSDHFPVVEDINHKKVVEHLQSAIACNRFKEIIEHGSL